MRSASYTKGAHTSITQYSSYNDSNIHGYNLNYTIPERKDTSNNPLPNDFSQSKGLNLEYNRRHAVSMSAAPLSTNTYRYPNKLNKSPESCTIHPRLLVSNSILNIIYRFFENSKFFNNKCIRQNKKEFVSWLFLFAMIVVAYKYFSDGSFSAVLTLASAFQCFSMVLLNLKIISQQTIAGISLKTVLLISLCLIFRLVSTLFYNGYLPVDKSGDWLYQGADVVSAILGIHLLVYAHRYCSSTIEIQKDKDTCVIVIPVVVTATLALLIHPKLNQNIVADTFWTFGLYLETFAMIPQLFLMVKLGDEVEALTSHYVASMAVSKILSIVFWYFSFAELAPRDGGRNIAGWAVIISYGIQVSLFMDFLYRYINSIRRGRKMIISF